MKYILMCLLFAPILYLVIRQKRKLYLYLLFAFLTVLPEQFGVDLHEKLPMITGTRVLILVLAAFWLWDRWKEKRLILPISLVSFFAVNLIISCVNFRFGLGEINRIFILIFERVLLAVMIADSIDSRETFDRCIDFLILGASVLAVLGIVQTIFEYDITTVLHLETTLSSSIHLQRRMGLERAFGTFNPISFGCYCAMIILLVFYRIYNTKKLYYSAALALIICALICTLTRSAWLCIAGVFLVMAVYCGKKLLKRLLPAAAMTVALCLVLCLFQPYLGRALLETGKSSINTVLGILPDEVVAMILPEDDSDDSGNSSNKLEFELDEDFGINGEDPTYSRMAQWTAVEHMFMEGNGLFGLGYNALPEGRIHFYFDRWGAVWEPTTFLDVGLVALIADSGILGAVALIGLLGFMLVYAFRRRDRENRMDFYHIVIYMIPLFLLLNFLASFMFEETVWLFISLFYAYKALDNKQQRDRECLILTTK